MPQDCFMVLILNIQRVLRGMFEITKGSKCMRLLMLLLQLLLLMKLRVLRYEHVECNGNIWKTAYIVSWNFQGILWWIFFSNQKALCVF